MPTWAYIYCSFIVFSSVFCLFAKDRLRKSYQPAGEVLDAICAICIFLIAFNILKVEYEKLIATTAVFFSIFWSYHAHRQFFDYEKFKAEIHQADKEIDEELLEEYGDEYESTYDYEDTERRAKKWFVGIVAFMALALVPYIYAYLLAVGFVN